MFNAFIYDKQLRLSKEIDTTKKRYMTDIEHRKVINVQMTQNYKKRCENFVINMIENPIVVSDYVRPNAELRSESLQPNIGDPQIYVKGFKHEKDRIKEAVHRNKDLDFLPNQIVQHHQFRERDSSKDIQKELFRFKDKTSLERIQQFLKDHTQTQVENQKFDSKKFELESLSENMSALEKRSYVARQIAKNLLPSLHNKTHFQAAQAMYNNLPMSLVDHTKSLPSLKKEPEVASEYKVKVEQLKSEQANELETFNPIETSKQILQNCNVIKRKNPKINIIHPGEGHLISTLDRSISEVYKDMYNIEIGKNFKTK